MTADVSGGLKLYEYHFKEPFTGDSLECIVGVQGIERLGGYSLEIRDVNRARASIGFKADPQMSLSARFMCHDFVKVPYLGSFEALSFNYSVRGSRRYVQQEHFRHPTRPQFKLGEKIVVSWSVTVLKGSEGYSSQVEMKQNSLVAFAESLGAGEFEQIKMSVIVYNNPGIINDLIHSIRLSSESPFLSESISFGNLFGSLSVMNEKAYLDEQ